MGAIPNIDLFRQMNIVRGPSEDLKPLNVGLLFFCEKPERFFRGAKIEVVEYRDTVGDDFSEKSFTGPINQQLKEALQYIKASVLKEEVRKIPNEAKAERFFNYPYEAIEEALANAVYHRSYEDLNSIEVNVWSDRIEVLSYPGPIPPVDNKQLMKARVIARYYRNRRVGDFLKELGLTEGRGTGIPKIRNAMRRNGSPVPKFETDRGRTYFLTVLPMHPKVVSKLPAEIAGGDMGDSARRVLEFCSKPRSRKDILDFLGLTNQAKNYEAHIEPLLKEGLLQFTIPDKPRSMKQNYVITAKGQEALKG